MSEGKKLSDLTLKEHAVGIIGIGVIFAAFIWHGANADKWLDKEKSAWEKRLLSGYFNHETYDDLGLSEWHHTDENGSKLMMWYKVVSKSEHGTLDYWIVIRFDGNQPTSKMISYDIAGSIEAINEIIKEK